MREIKFRAWSAINKMMYIPRELVQNIDYKNSPLEVGYFDDSGCPKSLLNVPLMQFTGLHDKNGKEIYEGDIVRDKSFNYKTKRPQTRWRIFVVYWHDETASFWQKLVKMPSDSQRLGILDHNYAAEKECEVIGNIYENPELVKDE